MLYYLEAHMKKKFLKLAKRQAKQTPKTIGRIVHYLRCVVDFKSCLNAKYFLWSLHFKAEVF